MSFEATPYPHHESLSTSQREGDVATQLHTASSRLPEENVSKDEKENLVWLETMIKNHEASILRIKEAYASAPIVDQPQLKKKIHRLIAECDVFKKGRDKLTKKALIDKINTIQGNFEEEWENTPILSDQERIEAKRKEYDIVRHGKKVSEN